MDEVNEIAGSWTDDAEPALTTLTAGPMAAAFDHRDASLRWIRFAGVEVLRTIVASVRDHNWGTVPAELHDVRVQQAIEGFSVQFHATHRCGDIDFAWSGVIIGEAGGRLRFSFDGEAVSAFRRNRIGYCVLHPLQCAGGRCRVTHVDGSITDGVFPRDIAPHQPFTNIRTIEHEPAPGLHAAVTLEGDVFEMEDHRNWTDASFKTYCTPLERPFPVTVRRGERIRQQVTVELTATRAVIAARVRAVDATVRLQVHRDTPLQWPQIGLEAPAGHEHTAAEIAALRTLPLDHLRVTVMLDGDDARQRLEAADAAAAALGAKLEVALLVGDGPGDRLRGLAGALRKHPIGRVLLVSRIHTSTPAAWIPAARQALGDVPLYVGTDTSFVELNRRRPPMHLVDGVVFSMNPQVHAFDDASLFETLQGQAHEVLSARRFAEGKHVVISPVTLRMRWNPAATAPEPPSDPGRLPRDADPRQRDALLGAWTLGSYLSLADAGAASVTYFETVGARGVMERERGSIDPEAWPTQPLQRYPVFEAWRLLGPLRLHPRVAATSSDPDRVVALAALDGRRLRLLLVNLTPRLQHVMLDRQTHELPPYGVIQPT